MKLGNCLFCQLQNKKDCIILENQYGYVIEDKFPARKGHLLIIPKEHYDTYFKTPLNIKKELIALMDKAMEYIEKTHQPTGYRIQINCEKDGMQEIFHTHIHLIPAYPDHPFVKHKENT